MVGKVIPKRGIVVVKSIAGQHSSPQVPSVIGMNVIKSLCNPLPSMCTSMIGQVPNSRGLETLGCGENVTTVQLKDTTKGNKFFFLLVMN